ncbi:MAG TPA: peptidoglycan-binding protein [Casimicrobiaceae bacterium]|nr:peptidoglycan-binding protein [Casimicrobiaceae bacterium]
MKADLHWRLEPQQGPIGDLQRGFAAELGDPLWLLGRQWHMGEHQGENASTPLVAELSVSETPIGAPADRPSQDPLVIPAEAIIEGTADDAWTLGMRIAVGLRAVSDGRVPAIDAGTDPSLVLSDLPQPYSGLSGLVYDGRALARNPAVNLAGIVPAVAALGDHWQSDELAYSTSFPCGDTVLRVDRHGGGSVDWWTVDAARPLTVTPQRTQHRAMPGRFRYPGAPAPRFWQIEDGHVDIGGFPPDRAHFATLLLIDLIASHSDDWFTFPFITRAGYVLRMHEVRVTDSFGDAWPAAGTSWEPMPPDEWSLFRVRGIDTTPAAGAMQREPTLVVWPSAATPLSGPAIDEVVLGVDEDANLMWAVEQRVSGVEQTQPPPPPQPAPDAAAEFVYRPTSAVPYHWHPYEIAAVDTNPALPGRRRFVQGRFADLHTDAPSTLRPAPRADVLNVPAGIHEIEPATIPTTGLKIEERYILARGTDARPVLWMKRQRLPLLGPPSHALRFDLPDPMPATLPALPSAPPAGAPPGGAPPPGGPPGAPVPPSGNAQVPLPVGTVPPAPGDPVVGSVNPPDDGAAPELAPARDALPDPPPEPLFGPTVPPDFAPDPVNVQPAVVLAQALLNGAGATADDGLPLVLDGLFGPRTAQAITRFQDARGIEPSGLLDAPTWNALMPLAIFATLLPLDPVPEGPPIARAQSALNRVSGGPPLTVNGVLDAATSAALSAFQAQQFLPATGGLDPATWMALAQADDAQQPQTLLRLVFSYTFEDFGNDPFAKLVLAEVLDQLPPTVDDVLPLGEQGGYWVEIHDAAGNILYRESVDDPIAFRAEMLDEDDLSAPTAADPTGTFELVVPVIPRAVTLLLFGPPPTDPERDDPSDVILTFDLTSI